MAAYFLLDTKASQVHTLSVTKVTTSWTDKLTVSGSNIKKKNQQKINNKKRINLIPWASTILFCWLTSCKERKADTTGPQIYMNQLQ